MSFTDHRGIRHTIEVLAETLYEAAGSAIVLFRRDGWTDAFGIGTRLTVEVSEPVVRHEVSIRQLQEWLDGTTASPNERLRKERLRALLKAWAFCGCQSK